VTRLLAVFASIAVAIAAAGVFGVMSYLVAQRRSEIGIRIALGAMPGDIVRRVLVESLAITGVGLAVGLAFAVGASRAVESMLYGVDPLDPSIYAALTAGLTVLALAASYLPARAASRTEAMEALRSE
jgi:putative ABC transport system permease protein